MKKQKKMDTRTTPPAVYYYANHVPHILCTHLKTKCSYMKKKVAEKNNKKIKK